MENRDSTCDTNALVAVDRNSFVSLHDCDTICTSHALRSQKDKVLIYGDEKRNARTPLSASSLSHDYLKSLHVPSINNLKSLVNPIHIQAQQSE